MTTDIMITNKNINNRNNNNCWKGIVVTDQLYTLLQKAIDIIPMLSVTTTVPSSSEVGVVIENDVLTGIQNDVDHDNNDTNIIPMLLLQQTIITLSKTTHVSTIQDAIDIVLQHQKEQNLIKHQRPQYITISTLRAIETIFDYYDSTINNNNNDNTNMIQTNTNISSSSSSSDSKSSSLSKELEIALQDLSNSNTTTKQSSSSSSIFVYSNSLSDPEGNEDDDDGDSTGTNINTKDNNNSSSSNKTTKERMKFQLRMQKLRFKHEEYKYRTITNNVTQLGIRNQQQDDITTKSMTYAASIGLNMIVAPISFGIFMYFFAGSLFDYFWVPSNHHHSSSSSSSSSSSTVDIKKVIAGVVSGVLMLFIEMLLFVIRTHEIDQAYYKKSLKEQKKNYNIRTTPNPFGHYTSNTTKSYVDR